MIPPGALTAEERAQLLDEAGTIEIDRRAWVEQLTGFLRMALYESDEESSLSTPRIDDARENALVAAFARVRRICDEDLPR